MNNDTFILATKFVQQCRKVLPTLNSKEFISNEEYRSEITEQLRQNDNADIELVLQAQTLKEKLAS